MWVLEVAEPLPPPPEDKVKVVLVNPDLKEEEDPDELVRRNTA